VQDMLWNTCFNHGAGLSVGRGNHRDVSKNSLDGSSAVLAAIKWSTAALLGWVPLITKFMAHPNPVNSTLA
jgi:hypothetical protein